MGACRFFNRVQDYAIEETMYRNERVKPVLPDLFAASPNGDGAVRARSGYVFPPFLVMERGMTLAEWLQSPRDALAVLSMFKDCAALLVTLHAAGHVHRDLKPSNILLNGNCDLKICDFGLARVANPEDHAGFLTAYVATRWYRAPEIMLSWREYTNAVDMWSVGCMLAEIIGRKPLFPGRDYIHQLKLVTDTIGTPSSEDIQYINSARARRYIESLPPKAKVEMGTLFPAASEVLRDLLDRMLIFDPRRRITVEEALEHPYLTSLHDPEDEPTCASVFYFPFEHQEPNAQQLRQLILEEFYVYYPHMRMVHSMHPKGYPP